MLIYVVFCLPSGPSLSAFLVNGPEVLDIRIVPSSKPQVAAEPPSKTVHPSISNLGTSLPVSDSTAKAGRENKPLANGISHKPQVTTIDSKVLQPISIEKSIIPDPDATPTATLTEPFNDLNLISPVPIITGRHADSQVPQSIPPQKVHQENGTKIPKQRRSKRESLPRKAKSNPNEPHRPGVSPVQPLQQNGHKVSEKEKLPPNEHPVPASDRAESGNGWRQTPILEDVSPLTNSPSPSTKAVAPSHHPAHLQPRSQPSRPRRSQRHQRREPPLSGWATEDATDSQALPEFDFAHNLSKFDKRGVFDQLKQEDTTADEDRLVSRNKAPRKLRHDENVLGNGTKTENHQQTDGAVSDGWAAGESELSMDEGAVGVEEGGVTRRSTGLPDHNQGSIRQGSSKISATKVKLEATSFDQLQQQHQAFSDRTSTDKPYGQRSKTATTTDGTKEPPKRKGITKEIGIEPLEAQIGAVSAAHHVAPNNPRSQQPASMTNQASNASTGSVSAKRPRPVFTYAPSKQPYGAKVDEKCCFCEETELLGECPTLTALQVFELEQIARDEFGLTEDLITENAGRNIAQSVIRDDCISCLGTWAVVLIAGNHRTGARVIAAGRHLMDRGGLEVIIYLLGYKNRQSLTKSVLTQLELFERCAETGSGHILDLAVLEARYRIIKSDYGIEYEQAPHEDLPGLDCPAESILCYLDGLLGVHIKAEELELSYQKSYSNMIRAISSQCCSERDISGFYTIDSFYPQDHPGCGFIWDNVEILALAAPTSELVAWFRSELRYPSRYRNDRGPLRVRSRIQPEVHLVDVGIPKGAWTKLGSGKWKDKIEYGPSWTRKLELSTQDGEMMTRDEKREQQRQEEQEELWRQRGEM